MQLDVIVAALDAGPAVTPTLERLQPLRARGARVTLADGGSRDDTVVRAVPLADRVIVTSRGLPLQFNAGARDALSRAPGDVLLFLPPAVWLPDDAQRLIGQALGRRERVWGCFDLRVRDATRAQALAAAFDNVGTRLTGLASPLQALFVERGAWLALQGFATEADADVVEFSARARMLSAPGVAAAPVTVAERAWQRGLVWREAGRRWGLRPGRSSGA